MEHCTGIPTDEATKWLVSAAARDISANQPMSLNQEKQIASLQGTRFEQADSVVVDDDIANYKLYTMDLCTIRHDESATRGNSPLTKQTITYASSVVS
jgi:hypothetical protein